MIFLYIPWSTLLTLIPLLAMFVIFINSHQMVGILLSLELFVCVIFMKMSMLYSVCFISLSFPLLFMCIMVCEAMLGIGILISVVRTQGNNMINN